MTQANLMTPDQAAEYLAISTRQLQLDRLTKRAIPFIKVGRLVRYRQADLVEYVNRQTVGGLQQEVSQRRLYPHA